MIVDRWLDGEVVAGTAGMFNNVVDELPAQAKMIDDLIAQEKHWDAYTRLSANTSLLNVLGQQVPSTQPTTITRLLRWIQNIRRSVEAIVRGLGTNGYSIGVSAAFGVSVSISFPA